MESEYGRKIVKNATLLTVAALLSKALSIGYRIPYQNITGDIGFYVYQQVYPFYGIAFMLAMYGFPVVISKLMSERTSQGDEVAAYRVLKVSFWLLTILGVSVFTILYLLAPIIAQFVGDPELEVAYRMMSFPFLVIPAISVLRGMFQAEENVVPTALSQLLEQCVRVVAIVSLAIYFISTGATVYTAGAGAAFGSFIGGIAGLLVLLFFFIRSKKRLPAIRRKIKTEDKQPIVKQLLFEGAAISLSALALVLFQAVDALTVLKQLKMSGLAMEEAKVLKGVFDRGQPLLQLGATVATSLSLVVVPMIVAAMTQARMEEVRQKASFALKISVIVGLAASSGLMIIIEQTNVMLFTDARGSGVLAILSLTILFSSITLTAFAILQGLGHVTAVVTFLMIGLVSKVLLNLIFIPLYGIVAAASATVISFAVTAILSLGFIQKKLKLFHYYKLRIVRIASVAVMMIVVAMAWKQGLALFIQPLSSIRLSASLIALSTVMVAVIVYVRLLFVFRVFSETELAFLPQREDMKTWLNKRRRGA